MKYFLAVVPKGLDENDRLNQVVRKLKRTVSERKDPARWVSPAMWHVTMSFFGPLSPENLERLKSLLEVWRPGEETELSLRGLGGFPSRDEGRSLWVGVRENRAFINLQHQLEQAFVKEQLLEQPGNNYVPHMTLVRFRHLRNLSSLIELAPKTEFGKYPLEELILFDSVIENQIPKYIPIFRKQL